MNTSLENQVPKSQEEFQQMSQLLALEFLRVLNGRTIHGGVVLAALMTVHRITATRMPIKTQHDIGFDLGLYAGQLLTAGAQAPNAEPASIPNPPASTKLH